MHGNEAKTGYNCKEMRKLRINRTMSVFFNGNAQT